MPAVCAPSQALHGVQLAKLKALPAKLLKPEHCRKQLEERICVSAGTVHKETLDVHHAGNMGRTQEEDRRVEEMVK